MLKLAGATKVPLFVSEPTIELEEGRNVPPAFTVAVKNGTVWLIGVKKSGFDPLAMVKGGSCIGLLIPVPRMSCPAGPLNSIEIGAPCVQSFIVKLPLMRISPKTGFVVGNPVPVTVRFLNCVA